MTERVLYYAVARMRRGSWQEYEVTRNDAGRVVQTPTAVVYRTAGEALDAIGAKNVELTRAIVR